MVRDMKTSKKIIEAALAELAKDDSTGYEAICEMATLDSFMAKPRGGKRLWVAIRQNEKRHAHIHIYDKAGKDRTTDNMVGFHTCVRLETAQYFHHDCYTDYLDSHQLRALARFLLSPVSPKNGGATRGRNNWEYAVNEWNRESLASRGGAPLVDLSSIPMPNYAAGLAEG